MEINKNTYIITGKLQFLAVYPLFISFLIYFIVFSFLEGEVVFYTSLSMAFNIVLSVQTILVVGIHIEYYMANKGCEFSINYTEKVCSYSCFNKSERTILFAFSDIKQIDVYGDDNGFNIFLPTYNYMYSMIHLNSGKTIVLTSLILKEIQMSIPAKVIRHKRLVAFID